MELLTITNQILVDLEGNLAYLTNDKLYIYNSGDIFNSSGFITHHSSDLGEPSLDKQLNFIDVDWEGTLQILVYLDGAHKHTFILAGSAGIRSTAKLDFPLAKRKAFQKMYLKIQSSAHNSIIYSIELDINGIKRRVYY